MPYSSRNRSYPLVTYDVPKNVYYAFITDSDGLPTIKYNNASTVRRRLDYPKDICLSAIMCIPFYQISTNIYAPISFILNRLPKSPPTSSNKCLFLRIIRPKLCFILHQLHRTCLSAHYTTPLPPIDYFGQLLRKWTEPQQTASSTSSNL